MLLCLNSWRRLPMDAAALVNDMRLVERLLTEVCVSSHPPCILHHRFSIQNETGGLYSHQVFCFLRHILENALCQ